MPAVTRSLAFSNSLAVDATAHRWIDWEQVDDLHKARQQYPDQEVFAYGEGTNLLLTQDIHKVCLHAVCQSLKVVAEQDEQIEIAVAAGTNWNWLVHFCLSAGWYGLENLVGIPGSCGAAPVQNIGAYGAEFADQCTWVECYDFSTGKLQRFAPDECTFSYRSSRFQHETQRIIIRMGMRLTTSISQWGKWQEQRLQHSSVHFLNEQQRAQPHDFAAAIAAIRLRKLPDAELIPNAGSFFCNPIVQTSDFCDLVNELSDQSAAWQVDPKRTKLSAAWLIDKSIGKGYSFGRCGLADSHALCLINTHAASGDELLAFAHFIRDKVKTRFGVELAMEPKLIEG